MGIYIAEDRNTWDAIKNLGKRVPYARMALRIERDFRLAIQREEDRLFNTLLIASHAYTPFRSGGFEQTFIDAWLTPVVSTGKACRYK